MSAEAPRRSASTSTAATVYVPKPYSFTYVDDNTLVYDVVNIKQAATPKTYDIQGSAGHPHSVTLTATHFQTLSQNGRVTVSSSLGDHVHSITVSCA